MELLSRLKDTIKSKIIFDADHLKVIDINGHQAIQEKDILVCIPYLKEKNSILLKYKNVPTYEYVRPEISKYITALNKSIETSPEQTLRECLKDEFGIVLDDKYSPEILTPIFINEGSTSRYHICILPLMNIDYDQTNPTETDKMIMKENNVIIDSAELGNLVIYDIITRYSLDLFKKEYALY